MRSPGVAKPPQLRAGQTRQEKRMGHVAQAGRKVSSAVLGVAFALLVFAAAGASATNVQFVGNVGYSYDIVTDPTMPTAVLTADRIANIDTSGSGNLKMELWAMTTPFSSGVPAGIKLAEYSPGQLNAGTIFNSVNSGSIPFVVPPNGTWTFVMLLTEFTNAATDGGYVVRDFVNFFPAVLLGPPPTNPITPKVGLWWNPGESGTGYALDVSNGTLVVTIYSFQTGGAAQWYTVAGQIIDTAVTGTLDKYVAGQCISCIYTGRPSPAGNDGFITIQFMTPTLATLLLPGGRVTQIQPFFP
jgi:hypothetical protein